jgi:DNA-binding response OmpR family regulator
MDSMLSTAARALSLGDPLLALKGIALRNDASALALRGVAMAQLGDLLRAQKLLRRATRAFEPSEVLARARCVTAQAEVALALRELSGSERELVQAARVLEQRGDLGNAFLSQLILARRRVLLGRVEEAASVLARLNVAGAPARLAAVAELVSAEVFVRKLQPELAAAALQRARRLAASAKIPALSWEAERAEKQLAAPAARLVRSGEARLLDLAEVGRTLLTRELVVDACRRELRCDSQLVNLRKRPVLFTLLSELAQAAPEPVSRERLIASAFGALRANESHRVRLRVEIGRLRKLLAALAGISATPEGFVLEPQGKRRVLCLLPPAEGEASALVSLLAGGEAWSTSALALALGKSQRSVQRALSALEETGTVRGLGQARARRWVIAPSAGFATTLLLVAQSPLG